MKVDRHTKTKKSIFCNLEIFCVRDKDFPVEVVEHKGLAYRQTFRSVKLSHCFQTPSWTSRGSRKANGLLLCHLVTRTSEIQDQVSPLRPISASTSLNEAREISNSFVSKILLQIHPQVSHGDFFCRHSHSANQQHNPLVSTGEAFSPCDRRILHKIRIGVLGPRLQF